MGTSAIHFSCSLTSCAVAKRSSGSLARQVFTTRSKAGGVSGCEVEMGGGSDERMAAITLAMVLPVNAGRPVAIS